MSFFTTAPTRGAVALFALLAVSACQKGPPEAASADPHPASRPSQTAKASPSGGVTARASVATGPSGELAACEGTVASAVGPGWLGAPLVVSGGQTGQASMVGPDGPAVVIVQNGDGQGADEVSSATVAFDGAPLLQISAGSRLVVGRVELAGQHALTVDTAGQGSVRIGVASVSALPCPLADVDVARTTGKPESKTQTFGPPDPHALGVLVVDFVGQGANGQVHFNGVAIQGPDDARRSFATVVSLKDRNVLEVRSEGKPGSSVRAQLFDADSLPPSVAITAPPSGAVFSSSPVDVGGTRSPDAAAVSVSGVLATLGEGAFSAAVPLAEGGNSVTAVARDACGNVARDCRPIILDTHPPVIAITGVTDGEITRTPVTPVWTVTELHPVSTSATLNGEPFVSGTQVAAEGEYDLVVTAKDRGGLSATAKLHFSLLLHPPVIHIEGVTDGEFSRVDLTPRFSAESPHLDKVTATLNGLPFESGTVVSAEGTYRLVVTALDLAGNSSQQELGFTVDKTAPVIAISGVTDGELTNAAVTPVIKITDVDPNVESSVVLDGAPFTPGTPVSSEGAHLLAVEATDRAGNHAERTLHFELDLTPPAITFSGVTDGELTNHSVTPGFSESDLHLLDHKATLDGEPFTSGTEVTAEGAHVLQLDATDGAGNVSSQTVHFELDFTRPEISVAGVSEGAVKAPPVAITFPATDLHLTSTTATLDGIGFESGDTVSPEGSHTLVVTATDGAGNSATKTVKFEVDGTPPAIAITGVTEGELTNAPVTPEVTVTDAHPGETALTLDGQPYVSGTPVTTEGVHQLSVSSTDLAGNHSTAQRSFTLDFTPPSVTVAGVTDGERRNQPITVTFFGEDVNGVTVQATLNGQPFTSVSTVSAEGEYDLVVTVTDGAGNVITVHRHFVIDLTAPALALVSPSDGLITSAASVEVVLAAHDAGPIAQVKIGTVVLVPDGDHFRGTVSLAEGTNLLQAVAYDAAGNSATLSFTVIRDSQAPVLTVSSPIDGQQVGGESLQVVGNVTDATAVSVSVNGVPATVGANGGFDATVPVQPGTNAITVQATDAAGNQTTVSLMVQFNATPPTLSLSEPVEGFQFTDAFLTVRGVVHTAVPGDSAHVTVDGEAVALDAFGNFASTLQLPVGPHTVQVVATDDYGLSTTRSVSVTRQGETVEDAGTPSGDFDAGVVEQETDAGSTLTPVLVLDAPTEGLVSGSSSVAVSGAIREGAPPFQVKVNGTPVAVNGTTFAAAVTLSEGTHPVTVQVTDGEQRTALITRTVTVDRTNPFLQITQPDANPATVTRSPYTLAGLVSDPNLATVTVNGSPALVLAGAFSLPVSLQAGSNTFHIEASDLAGNVSAVDQVLQIASIPPEVVILSPLDGTEASEPVIEVKARIDSPSGIAGVQIGTGAANEVSPGVYAAQVPLSLGDNAISVSATDDQGLSGSASVTVHYRDVSQEPLAVTGVDPAPGATGVGTESLINVAFNKAVKSESLPGHFQVLADGEPLAGGYALAPGGQTAIFVARAPLPSGSLLHVIVEGVEPAQGPAMDSAFQSSFTVRAPLVSVHGQVMDETLAPLSGVRVEMEGTGFETRTGPDGTWALVGVPGGASQVMRYTGGTTSDGRSLPTVRRSLFVEASGQTSDRPLFLVPVNGRSAQRIDGSVGGTIDFAGADGALALGVPPGGLAFADGTTVGEVTATELPAYARPVPLLDTINPSALWQVGPAGLQVLKPLTVTLPNRTALDPGRMVVLLGFDPERLGIQRVGLGHVSADGTAITGDGPVQLAGLDVLGYMALSTAQQAQVEAAIASLSASEGTPDGGLGLRGFSPVPRPAWERVLQALLPAAHAQLFQDPFTFGMAALDQLKPGIALVTGKVRAPRANEVTLDLQSPSSGALPHDVTVELPYALPLSVTARYVSNDPVVSGSEPEAITLGLSAVGTDGRVVSPPAGQSWSTSGQGEATLTTQVPLTAGATQLDLSGLASGSSRHLKLSVTLTPQPSDGGVQTALLNVIQVSDPEGAVDPLGGSAYFSGIRVDLTSQNDSVAATGASGGYGAQVLVPGPDTMGISCARLPLGSRSVAYLDGDSTLFAKVDPDFYACSPTYSLDPGASMRADVLVDVRYFTGKLQFRNRDGTPVPALCQGDEGRSVWSEGGKALAHLSSQDVATTEVHFFREGHLDTPIAKYTVAEPLPVDCTDGAPSVAAQAKFARVWVGPANPTSKATRAKCERLEAEESLSPDDLAFLKTQCSASDSSFMRLSPGDRLVVFAVNHATGYAGETTVVVPPIERQPLGPDGGCPADDSAGGPLTIEQGGETVTLSRCAQADVTIPANLDLYPPELDVTVARAADEEGVSTGAPTHLVRTGGAGTTRDNFIQVSTNWRVRLAPAGTSSAGDGGVALAVASQHCVDGKLVDGGDCLPDVLVDAQEDAEGNALDAGEQLEVYCSELPPTADAQALANCLRDGRELVDVPEGVPPLAGQLIAVTGTAVEQPAVAVFPVRPGQATANVQASLRRVDANGEHEVINNLKRANYYVHVVGNRLLGRDTNGDGYVSPKENDAKPPDFSESPDGGLAGMPAKALWLKAVYRRLEGGATPVAHYDRAKEHEFRVVELTPKSVTATTTSGTRGLYPDGGSAPSASPDDLEYQFLAGLLEDGPSRAGTLTGNYEVRLGSDEFGINCPIHLDEASHTLSASCENGYLPDVLSASDVLYLEVYLSGNAENVLYRFNFNGLSARKDLIATQTAYTAKAAVTTDEDGTPAVGRPVSIPPVASFYVDPTQLTQGTVALCTTEDCLGESVLKEATVSLQSDGHYQVTDTERGSVKAPFSLSERLGGGGAQLFRLALPPTLASMPLPGSVASRVYLKLSPSDARQSMLAPSAAPQPPTLIPLGTPKGIFDGRNSVSRGHTFRAGIDVADGHLSFTHQDFSLPFRGGAITFSRTYNNQDNGLRPLGVGWTNNYDGWVVEERFGHYAVVLNGQAYVFPSCTLPKDDAEQGNASDCQTDKSHGLTLNVHAPINLERAGTPSDHLVVTTPDGWEYDFDKQVGQPMQGKRRWLLTRFADAHRTMQDGSENPGVWMDLTYGQGNRLERVKRHDGAAELDFNYTDISQTDPDVPEALKTRGMHGFSFLSRVDVKVAGDPEPAWPYSVSFKQGPLGNLTRAATDGGAAPYQIWVYDYLPVADGIAEDQRWAAVNELSEARLIHGALPDADQPAQWKAHYARKAVPAPYLQGLSLEVVTSALATGMQGQPLEVSFDGTTRRTVTHPDGVTESFTLNEHGDANERVLPSGAKEVTTWGSDEQGGQVFAKRILSPAGYGVTRSPTDRLLLRRVQMGASPSGALPVSRATSGTILIDEAIDDGLGVPTGGTVASADGPLPIASPRTPSGDLAGLTVGPTASGSEQRELLKDPSYDSDGVLLSATDAEGRFWEFGDFNALGEPREAMATLSGAAPTGLATLTRLLTYDALGRVRSVSEVETGKTERWRYDGLGRVTYHFIAGTPNEEWTYEYEDADLSLSVSESLTKPDGVEAGATHLRPAWAKTTTYTEDDVSESHQAGNPAVEVTQTTHFVKGRPDSMTDEGGHVWRYHYDVNGHLTSVTAHLTSETAEGLTAQSRTVDADGRPIKQTDSLGAETRVAYDALGRAASWDYGAGDMVESVSDAQGALTRRNFKDGSHLVTYTSDALGQPSSATSGGGVSTQTRTDSAGRTVRFEDETRGLLETYSYADVLGRLTHFTRTVTSGDKTLTLDETRSYDDAAHTISVARSIETGLAGTPTRTEAETLTTDVRGRVLAQMRPVERKPATTAYEYNERGQLWRTTSPLGEVTRRYYDVQGQLAETVDAEGYRTEYLRDGLERILEETGPHPGRDVTYGYDALGRMLSKTVAAYETTPEMEWTYAYPGQGQVEETAKLSSGDIVTTRMMNGRGRVVSETVKSAEGQLLTRNFTFDGPWQHSETTTEGSWQRIDSALHDDLGRVLSSDERWSNGDEDYAYVAFITWDGLSASASWTDETGSKRQSYSASLLTDSFGHLVRQEQGGVISAWAYDGAGKLSQVTPAGRPSTELDYDNGLLKGFVFGPSVSLEATIYVHDLDGRVESVATPDGRTHRYWYSPRGQVLTERYGTEEPDGTPILTTSTEYTYDALGALATKTEGAGTPDARTWTYAHGPRGEIQSTTQPDGIGAFLYGYDGLLRLTSVKPPKGSPSPWVTYGYDYLGRQTANTRGASLWVTSWSDGAGTTTTPLQDRVTRLYDGRGRLAEETYQPGPASAAQTDITEVRRRYTASDAPWEMVETHKSSGDVRSEYTYDALRRLQVLARGNDSVSYTYRDSGERRTVTSPAGTVTYGYDALERLSAVTGPAGSTTVEWERGGLRLLSLSDATLTERRCYDGRGWLTDVVNAGPDVSCGNLASASGLHSRFEYAYDGRGNRVAQSYLDGQLSAPEVTTYGYNGADWLTGVKAPDNTATLYKLDGDGTRRGERQAKDYTGGLGPEGYRTATNLTKDWTYGFDAQGGLLAAMQPDPTDASRQMQVAAWTTDAAGRVTHSVTPDGTRDFAWGSRDTLFQATFTPAIAPRIGTSAVAVGDGTPVTANFGYDGNGLRRSRRVGENTTSYLWADGELLEERLPEQAARVYENAAGLTIAAGADRLAHDGLGSVVGLVGATQATRKYDAWGNFVDGTAPSAEQPSVAYAGQSFDAELGISNAQQRWEDLHTGRWLSMDPVGVTGGRLSGPVGLNAWLYADANPLRFTDPAGTDPAECSNVKGISVAEYLRCVQREYAALEQGRPSAWSPQLGTFRGTFEIEQEKTDAKIERAKNIGVALVAAPASILAPELILGLAEAGSIGSTTAGLLTFGSQVGIGAAAEKATTGQITPAGLLLSGFFGTFAAAGVEGEFATFAREGSALAVARPMAEGLPDVRPPVERDMGWLVRDKAGTYVPAGRPTAPAVLAETASQLPTLLRPTYRVGDVLPSGRIAGWGPGAAAIVDPAIIGQGAAARTGVAAAKGIDDGFDMALGLARHGETGNPQLLNRFAGHVNAKTYGQLQGTWWPGSMERLEATIAGHMQGARRLHFNLDQVDLGRFRQFAHNPTFSDHNITNWELHRILTTPDLLKKTTFYGPGGVVVSPPALP